MAEKTASFLLMRCLQILLVVFLGLLVYSNTFDAPFQFDDHMFVMYRETELEVAEAGSDIISLDNTNGPWASRPLLYASFVINQLLGGFNSWGYHVMNVAMHLCNGILLYLLIIMTGRHLGHNEEDIVPVALLSSLLFVLHPVHTESVTYIVSRSMLMVTSFCLLGLIFFLKATTSSGRRKFLLVFGLLVSTVLGAASREDFAIFPVVLFVYDLFFLSRFRLRAVAGHAREYAAILPGIVCLGYFVITNTYDKSAEAAGLSLPSELALSPLQFALTQFKVHWTYIRLLIFPVNQNIDHFYPVTKTLFELPTILSFLGYFGLWVLGLFLAKKRPVASFGVLWFLIALVPVSFAVALLDLRLGDVIFEHRLYLPSLGLIVLVSLVLVRLARERKAVVPAIIGLCVVLGVAAYARNSIWTDEGTLWTDAVNKSPNSPRAHNNLGLYYKSIGFPDEALRQLEIALSLWPDNGQYYNNIATVYFQEGLTDKAIEYFKTALQLNPELDLPHANLGTVYESKGMHEEALGHYLEALRLDPGNTALLNKIAITYYVLGQKGEAINYYVSSLWLNRKQPSVLNNLGLLFMETGQKERAIKHLEPLVAIEPEFVPARLALGRLYTELGFPIKAIEHLRAAEIIRPDEPEIQRALSEAYIAARREDKQPTDRSVENR